MVTYTKKALIALSLVGSVAVYTSEDNNKGFTRNVVTGKGNVIIKHYGPGTTIHQFYGDNDMSVFTCGEIVEKKEDGFKITNIDCATPASDIKTKKIQLTGTKKRMPLNDAIDTVSLSPYFGEVTINDRDSYIECDEAVFGSDLEIKVFNGRLAHRLKKNTSTEFTGTGGKPLCSIYAKLLNGALKTEHASQVKINTSAIRTLKAKHSSVIAADKDVKLDQLDSLVVKHSSVVDLPNVSVPVLTAKVLHSSKVMIAGDADKLDLTVKHKSSFDGSNFRAKLVDIDAAYGSKAKLWVTKILQGFASFKARIWHKGGAQERVKTRYGASCERDNK